MYTLYMYSFIEDISLMLRISCESRSLLFGGELVDSPENPGMRYDRRFRVDSILVGKDPLFRTCSYLKYSCMQTAAP